MTAIAYLYDADTHCPPCALERFGPEPGRSWPRDDATDSEGNFIAAVFPWDQWHASDEPERFTLECADCHVVLAECDHAAGMDDDPNDCDCDACIAMEGKNQ